MKKVVTAINNKILVEQLKKCGKYLVHEYDLDNQENVNDYLRTYDADVLITKDSLEGNMTKEEYVESIRNINPKVKIIFCVNKLNDEFRGYLFSKNIFDIIEGDEIKFTDVINMIDSKDKMILVKDTRKANITSNINVVTKQKICVYGTSGGGKSYVASLIAQLTSKKLKLNTLLVDLDIQNAAIDIYNNLSGSGNNLQYVMEEIDRGSFNSQVLQDLVSKEKRKNGKLSFITNNMGIYECQNKFSKDYYEKLYNETDSRYDVLIMDMPNAPFLDIVPYSLSKTDKVFFVINPNFISIRQAIKYLDLITNIWKVPKDNIFIIVNRVKRGSLDTKQVKAILKDYNVCLEIAEDNDVEGVINGLSEITLDKVDKVEKLDSILDIFVDNTEIKRIAKQKLGDKYDN